MSEKKIYITERDAGRLRDLIGSGTNFGENGPFYLKQLVSELDRAEIVESQKIPRDIVTMNSLVQFRDLSTNEVHEYSIVYPTSADHRMNKVSILAPIGLALLGCRVNDIVEWPVPAGTRRLKIEKVLYQPEAAGEFDL
ncbi:MAG: Regulator of nucleoside diphosphate kinase [Candidatus Omnitrophica bacterium ADurb.Bin277]|nr:MAG: Regulator of nucleoside diphosphate kinase [Candidatus Omnitrophica bacterium ADurb.Bin277]